MEFVEQFVQADELRALDVPMGVLDLRGQIGQVGEVAVQDRDDGRVRFRGQVDPSGERFRRHSILR